ncbi:MAG: hypothetical protein JSU01_09335 [Bacteroidetes bacterium]|nr:hypothetical protein [Bacteroidota bacterium]
MNAELRLNEILSQVKKLNKLDQAVLLKKIKAMVHSSDKTGKQIKLSEISGLGSALWHGINIDQYVDDERQW